MQIPLYIWLALFGAFGLAMYSFLIKVIVRYRLCSPVLSVLWIHIAGGAVSLALVLIRPDIFPFPIEKLRFFIAAFMLLALANLLLAIALQEGDASLVVPLLGLKIPMVAGLSFLLVGESHSPMVYVAVILSAGAVFLFGFGRPAVSQGGNARHPVFALILGIAAALVFSCADIAVKKCIEQYPPMSILAWSLVCTAILFIPVLYLPMFRKYRIAPADIGFFVLAGVMLLLGGFLFFWAVARAGNVTLPNIVLSMRGFFALLAGFLLGRTQKTPIEKQTKSIYVYRTIATFLLFVSILLILK